MRCVCLLMAMVSLANAAVRQMETLGRGMNATVLGGKSVYVNWRLLYSDPKGTGFNLYRSVNGAAATKLNSSVITKTTDWTDATVSTANANTYYVKPVVNGFELAASASLSLPANAPVRAYRPIALKTLNDTGYHCVHVYVGDLDGDGEYDFVVKRMRTSDTLSTIKLDAYKNNGTFMWRVDLGPNIEKGNSTATSPVLVYDFNGDGKAEVWAKTGEGTTFGNGTKLGDLNGDGKTDYRAATFYLYNVLSGPEYVSMIDGTTGKELARDNFIARGTDKGTDFGDSYGHRMNFIFTTVAFLDGVHPSIVMSRGVGDLLMKVQAWTYSTGTLSKVWYWENKNRNGGVPNDLNFPDFHAIRALDLDGDGKDEISWGGGALKPTGTPLYGTILGHGDRFQIADIVPSRKGLECYAIQQLRSDFLGAALYDATTGTMINKFYGTAVFDAARGEALDIDSNYAGMEMWSTFGGLRSAKGDSIAPLPNLPGLGIWWDGDLLREMLQGIGGTGESPAIEKYNSTSKTMARYNTLYNVAGSYNSRICYGGRPQLYGDIVGDWREEVVAENGAGDTLQIFSTTVPAGQRVPCLMQDPVYRNCVNVKGYIQSTNLGYFLGHGTNLDSIPGYPWASANAPVFSSGKSLSVPETTTAVVQCKATSSVGGTVVYAIVGGDDSALFKIVDSTGVLTFKVAPDFEKPADVGADNIYKVIVGASNGQGVAVQSIAVLVTNVAEATGIVQRSTGLVQARVVWLDVRGNTILDEEQWLDPASPRPLVPSALHGLNIARISIDGRETLNLRCMGKKN